MVCESLFGCALNQLLLPVILIQIIHIFQHSFCLLIFIVNYFTVDGCTEPRRLWHSRQRQVRGCFGRPVEMRCSGHATSWSQVGYISCFFSFFFSSNYVRYSFSHHYISVTKERNTLPLPPNLPHCLNYRENSTIVPTVKNKTKLS